MCEMKKQFDMFKAFIYVDSSVKFDIYVMKELLSLTRLRKLF